MTPASILVPPWVTVDRTPKRTLIKCGRCGTVVRFGGYVLLSDIAHEGRRHGACREERA
jgi:hypothetical protein